jgi:hypothetical protein
MAAPLHVETLAGSFAICRLPADAPIPDWVLASPVPVFLARTDDELSIIATQEMVPDATRAQRDYRALRVAGPLAFGLVGVMAALTTPLARAGISILAVSTYETDYVFVPALALEVAQDALRQDGHLVR